MTDFIADLESELVAAARRRARRRVPRPRLVPVVAALAIAVAAFAVLRGVDGSRTADETPAGPKPGVVVTLPAAEPLPDDAGCRAGLGAAIPAATRLAVFARPQAAQDRRPPASFGALPVDFVDEDSLRAPGGAAGFHIIRVAGLSGPCDAERRPLDPGVCLIVGAEPAAARCFGDDDVAAGRAITTSDARPGWVYGIVPDGVDTVKLSWSGGTLSPRVVENSYSARLDGAKAGDDVRIELVPPAACGPSQAAYDAVPALRRGAARRPPPEIGKAMTRLGAHGAWRSYARVVGGRDGVNVWAVPYLPCDDPKLAEERVCAVPEGGVGPVCGRPAAIRRRGISISVRDGTLITVGGFAPAAATRANARIRDVVDPLPVRDGVFGAKLVDRLGDPVHITYR